MNVLNQKVVLVSSLLIVAVGVADVVYRFSILDLPDFYTTQDKLYEYSAILFQLWLFLPAVTGLYIYVRRKGLPYIVSVLYLLYLSIIIFIFLYEGKDSLEVGLFLVVIGIPFSLFLSIFSIMISENY